ncbi:MAG: hypothetical protein ACFFCP_11110 [Promethearchaeota archaeon]
MFIGHYGVAFALKRYAPKTSLGILFIATQLADIAFFILVALGIEHLRIIPGFTESNPFDLYDYPITHSLLGAFAWSLVTYLAVRFIPLKSLEDTTYRKRAAFVLSIAVFSHFVLDFIVHTPDLLLIPGLDMKVGLGLWNSLVGSIVVELAILLVGCGIYLRSIPPGAGSVGKYGMYVFMIVLAIITVVTPFMTFPSVLTVVITSELLYVSFTLVAWWLDKKRSPAIQLGLKQT